MSDNVLEIKNISVCFDGFWALTEVKTNVKRNLKGNKKRLYYYSY